MTATQNAERDNIEMKNVEKIYTTDEIANLFRVKQITVWDWIRKGKLRAKNIGTKGRPYYRITQKQLDRFMNSL